MADKNSDPADIQMEDNCMTGATSGAGYNDIFAFQWPPVENVSIEKGWHRQITVDVRNHVVKVYCQSIWRLGGINESAEQLVTHAIKVEKEAFEQANGKYEYYEQMGKRVFEFKAGRDLPRQWPERNMVNENTAASNVPAPKQSGATDLSTIATGGSAQAGNISGDPSNQNEASGLSNIATGSMPWSSETQKMIQKQLVLLLHASKCQARDRTNPTNNCKSPECNTMKDVLTHLTACEENDACTVPHCASSKKIIAHWNKCPGTGCDVCLPCFKEDYRDVFRTFVVQIHSTVPSGGATGESGSGQGCVGVSLPVDVSKEWHKQITHEMKTLLITKYIKAIFPQYDPQQTFDPRIRGLIQYAKKVEKELFELANNRERYYFLFAEKVYKIGKEILEKKRLRREENRAESAIGSGKWENVLFEKSSASTSMAGATSSVNGERSSGFGPRTGIPPVETAAIPKEWHNRVNMNVREKLVNKLAKAIFPLSEEEQEQTIKGLIPYAKQVETEIFQMANDEEEYYTMLAEKIFKVQKALRENSVVNAPEHEHKFEQNSEFSGCQSRARAEQNILWRCELSTSRATEYFRSRV